MSIALKATDEGTLEALRRLAQDVVSEISSLDSSRSKELLDRKSVV